MRSGNRYSGETQISIIRVTEWDRDGITIEADQRHVRETMKRLELEQANHSATPCAVARRDESKGENRCRRRQTKHRWDDVNDDDDKDRLQIADDDANDSQALTGGDITRYRALVARISYLSQDRPDLKFASMTVCCVMAKPSLRDMECVKRIDRYLVGKPRAKCWFRWQQSGDLEADSDADWGGDRATRRSVSAGVITRRDHCLKVWTEKQQVVALSSAESELYAAVKTASEGLGIQSVAKDLGISCRLNLHPDASATMCLVNRRVLGKAKHVDMQNLWIQEASKSGRFVTKKVDTSVNPADLMTKPVSKARIEQLISLMGYEFVDSETSASKGLPTMTPGL